MLRITVLAVILSWVLPGLAAATSTWTFGANMGLSILMPRGGGDDLTTVALPAQDGLLSAGTLAGLRIGVLYPDERREMYLDWGLSHTAQGGESLTGLVATLNYQHILGTGRSATEPYLTLGLGLTYTRERFDLLFGPETSSGTNPIFGAGLGVQHKIARRHGAVRGEVRYDRLAEGSGDLGLGSANVLGFLFGFDLWMK